MKLSDFTIWEGLFGIDGEFYLSHSTSNFYNSVISPHGYDEVLYRKWDTLNLSQSPPPLGIQPKFLITVDDIVGDSKNNFVFISPGLLSGELVYDEDRDCYVQENNFHILEHLFFGEKDQGVSPPHFPSHILKPKDELKKYFSKILGKDIFDLIENGKFKLILDSHYELMTKTFSETLLFMLEYVGLTNTCVLMYNSVSFDNPKIINWDYALYEFECDLQPIFEMGGYFPLSDSNIEYLSEYKKPKRYVCYNANLHGHRLFYVLWLYKNKLDKYGLISLLNRSEDTLEVLKNDLNKYIRFKSEDEFQPIYYEGNLDETELSIMELLVEYYPKFPIILDIDVDFLELTDRGDFRAKLIETYGEEVINNVFSSFGVEDIRPDRYIHIEHLIDTYFSIISETVLDEMHSGWDKDGLVHLTEKTYKGLTSPHPFILFANYGVLKYLKSLGFQTFPEMFDESYDEIKDTKDRMYFILNEIKRLCEMDIEELHEKYVSVLPKIKHNHELLLRFDRKELLLNKLMDISNA